MALVVPDPPVIIVDDDTGSRESMAIALEKAGFPVRTFDDARRALEYLENASPRLAICDLRMPGMDGLAFLQEVRKRGIELSVVKLPEAKRGFVLLPRRWVGERSFAWAARFRRLARDYERLPQTVAGLHFLAFVALMLRQLAHQGLLGS